MFGVKERQQLAEIRAAVSNTSGGVYKRIDENRELLALLLKEAPELIQRRPWVISWIKSADEFLTEIEHVSGVPHVMGKDKLPRSWPDMQPGVSKEWAKHAYPLKQVFIKLQGSKHSDLSWMLGQLEKIQERIKSGARIGHEDDDDFGYSFAVSDMPFGPSIFNEFTPLWRA